MTVRGEASVVEPRYAARVYRIPLPRRSDERFVDSSMIGVWWRSHLASVERGGRPYQCASFAHREGHSAVSACTLVVKVVAISVFAHI
ncbi:hypothetical protein EVAR_21716_1 [Eumeta japonica]|uniref:Uncharacterized protein n=1 Tax=Eumeta variegata TaxID=151549 RepID=A0A4C1W6N0_EUMVA|nr:hypothetical protein EVAR_21716_1 [Eumeta japonica]